MKKLFFSLLLISAAFISKAQSVAINSTGSAADASAMLDVTSTSKGLLLPRMTVAQRNAISSPATGLMIYQTNGGAGMYLYTGSEWKNMSPVVDLVVTKTNSHTLPIGGSSVTPDDLVFNTVVTTPSLSNGTTNASYNTSTGEYTVGVSGFYNITAVTVQTSATIAGVPPTILVNGNSVIYGVPLQNGNNPSGTIGRGLVTINYFLTAGDVVKIKVANNSNSATLPLSTDGTTRLVITKL